MRVLVVDDDADLREQIAGVCRSHGFEVDEAADGYDALRLLICPQRKDYDLILLDLMMPRMNGGELMTIVRQDPELARIPVVVVTAADVADFAVRGASVTVSKPFRLEHLERVIAWYATRNRSTPGPGGGL